jgi:hypothetical protein
MRAKHRSRFELVTSAFGEALRDCVVDRARECIARRLRRHLRDLNLQHARRLLQCMSLFLAHRVISRQRIILVAFEAERTLSRIYENTA